jgi:hypothetical protein
MSVAESSTPGSTDAAQLRAGLSTRQMILGALVGLAIGTILTFGLATRTGSTSTLVHFAPPFTDASSMPDSIRVLPETRGYDGQFYFRLAESPLSTAQEAAGVQFDHPALRMTRIGYPILAAAVSLIPVSTVNAMLLVNVISYGAIGVAGMSIATSAGRRPQFGLALLFVPAFVYGTTMSVTDTLAGALVLLGISFLLRTTYVPAAVSFSAAALTRETALLIPVVILAGLIYRRIRDRPRPEDRELVVVGLLPIICFVGWQSVVVALWGEVGPLSSGGKNLTVPFLGPIITSNYLDPVTTEQWMNILVPAATISIIAMAVLAFLRSEVERLNTNLAIGFGVATVIAVSVGPALLATYRNSVRGMGDAALLAIVAVLFGTGTWSRLALLSVVAVGGGLMMWELRIAPDLS